MTRTTAFTLSVTLALTVATPTITPNGGNFSGSVSVAMQTATSGDSIYYTTNGSMPTQSSSLYTGALTLSSDTTINAKAFKSGHDPSAVAAASFKNSIAKGATYWASPTGTSSSCVNSATDPGGNYLELYAAVACLSGGDTLMLKPGVYDKYFWQTAIPQGSPGAYTTIRGSTSGRDAILKPSQYYSVIYLGRATQRYIEFANMEINGSGVEGSTIKITDAFFDTQNPCADCGAHHIRFRNVLIDSGFFDNSYRMGATKNAILGGGPGFELLNSEIRNSIYGLYWTGADAVVQGNWFHHNRGYALHFYCGDGCGVGLQPINNNIVRFNLIENNATSVLLCSNALLFADGANNSAYNNIIRNNGPGKCGGGIQLQYGSINPKIYNNTVYGNLAGGIYVGPDSDGAIIRNNISYSSKGRDFVVEGGTNVTERNNLFGVNPGFGGS